MTPQIGQVYYRRTNCGVVTVRRLTAIDGDRVYFENLHGPSLKQGATGSCSINAFQRKGYKEWLPYPDGTPYDAFCGVKIHRTVLCRSTVGEIIFRCSEPKAKWYVAKGYAVECQDGIQFIDDTTERRLEDLYGDLNNPYFLAIKNNQCVVCGKKTHLTQHHVVPKRHKHRLPINLRRCLSNILFICDACHKAYENINEPDVVDDPVAWMHHFIEHMKPQYLPEGWSIISVRNIEKVS